MKPLHIITLALRTGWDVVRDIVGSRTLQVLTAVLVVGTLLFVWLSSYFGLDGGVAIWLIGIVASALGGVTAICVVFAVVVVAVLVDQLWKLVRR